MILKLKDVLPSPFRDLVRNPFNEAKILKLMSSIKETGFWDNVVVRKNKAGKYEAAYGHHRIEAAKRSGLTEASFIVKPLSDALMIKVMKAENDEMYGYSAPAMLESVRAVVYALKDGLIPPFITAKRVEKQLLRYAPSFVPGKEPGGDSPRLPYTALDVATFLDETESRGTEGGLKASAAIRTTLDALALIEQQELSEAALKGRPLSRETANTKEMGLVQLVRNKTKQREVRLEATKTSAERAALDVERRKQEAADKERRAELQRQEREANREKDEAEAKRLAEQLQRQKEREEARQKAFEESRARLDAKVKEANERAEAARTQDKDLPTRYAVKEMLRKLETIISERFAFREEVKSLSRDKAVTTNERELIRQALILAGDWYIEQANVFLPRPKVDVLAEAQQKEEAKRKRGRTNEQE